LPDILASDGVALLEIGADQGSAAPQAVEAALPNWTASVETDLAGLPRILRVARGAA
jgi:methylase of polypeptide subunit release factors